MYKGGSTDPDDICDTKNLIEFKKNSNGDKDLEISYYDNITNE